MIRQKSLNKQIKELHKKAKAYSKDGSIAYLKYYKEHLPDIYQNNFSAEELLRRLKRVEFTKNDLNNIVLTIIWGIVTGLFISIIMSLKVSPFKAVSPLMLFVYIAIFVLAIFIYFLPIILFMGFSFWESYHIYPFMENYLLRFEREIIINKLKNEFILDLNSEIEHIEDK